MNKELGQKKQMSLRLFISIDDSNSSKLSGNQLKESRSRNDATLTSSKRKELHEQFLQYSKNIEW